VGRLLLLIYGVCAYCAFLCTILYLIGFVNGIVVPKNINSGTSGPLAEAICIDLALLILFGLSHSVMARPAFKESLTKLIPKPAERSTYVLVASLALALLFWQWQPIDSVLWNCDPPFAGVLFTISMIGFVIVFWSSFIIDHFDLFGLRQVWLNYRGIEYTNNPFAVRSLYKYVRNPLMLGFVIAFWSQPKMTFGHLLFACGMTIYILIGIYFEERDLSKHLGEDYLRYMKSTPVIFPWKIR
jgi:methanethiol S-methyltransferase